MIEQKHITNIVVEKQPKSMAVITAEITTEAFESLEQEALKALGEHIEIPGFRKGHAPDAILRQNVSESLLLQEMAERALNAVYPLILEKEKIDAIGRPEITLTKIAKGNPLGFKITTAIVPEMKLPDYKKIAKGKNKDKKIENVSDTEVDEMLKNLQKMRAHDKMHEDQGLEHHDHSHGDIKDEDLPVLDDEFAKAVGNFETLADLKEKVRENLSKEKEYREGERIRVSILEDIIKDTDIDIPEILVEAELDKMISQMTEDVTRMGVTFEDYLKHLQKTVEDLRVEYRDEADKRAKAQLVLHEISKKESLSPDEKAIEEEFKALFAKHPDADPFRLKAYVDMVLTNEAVLKYLEQQ